jgi:hypothetical protein
VLYCAGAGQEMVGQACAILIMSTRDALERCRFRFWSMCPPQHNNRAMLRPMSGRAQKLKQIAALTTGMSPT